MLARLQVDADVRSARDTLIDNGPVSKHQFFGDPKLRVGSAVTPAWTSQAKLSLDTK